ncbi:hypothetical protein EYF80_016651 [Liparis tanakae]|uniref:Uncharacterized protein n=1 Tax=Liparis tanakae TaxID=230148 RepID=A0A4Z2I6T5_9TELE|nr:hypothetical protein EYF80_016651 [Liparis tanakae]
MISELQTEPAERGRGTAEHSQHFFAVALRSVLLVSAEPSAAVFCGLPAMIPFPAVLSRLVRGRRAPFAVKMSKRFKMERNKISGVSHKD